MLEPEREAKLPLGEPGGEVPPGEVPVGAKVVGDPGQPAGGVSSLVLVGVGSDEDAVEEVFTQAVTVGNRVESVSGVGS